MSLLVEYLFYPVLIVILYQGLVNQGLHVTGNTCKQTFTYVQETIVCVEGIPRVPFLVVAIALFAILGVLLDASPLAGILQLAQFGVAGWVSVQTLSTYR